MMSLISLENPETPSNPLSLLSMVSIWSGVSHSFLIKNVRTAGSRSHDLVPIINPSSGVNPIDVSTTSPFLIAVILAPFPT